MRNNHVRVGDIANKMGEVLFAIMALCAIAALLFVMLFSIILAGTLCNAILYRITAFKGYETLLNLGKWPVKCDTHDSNPVSICELFNGLIQATLGMAQIAALCLTVFALFKYTRLSNNTARCLEFTETQINRCFNIEVRVPTLFFTNPLATTTEARHEVEMIEPDLEAGRGSPSSVSTTR